jgi:hypothetical protein
MSRPPDYFTTYMGGGPSLMYAASAIAAFVEFSGSPAA